MVEVQKNVVKTHLRIGEFTPYSISICIAISAHRSELLIQILMMTMTPERGGQPKRSCK